MQEVRQMRRYTNRKADRQEGRQTGRQTESVVHRRGQTYRRAEDKKTYRQKDSVLR